MFYYVEFIAAPLCAAFLLTTADTDEYSALIFLAGFGAWTLAEYSVHRFIEHGFRRSVHTSHMHHHAKPDKRVTEFFGLIWTGLCVFLFLFGPVAAAGALIGYSWYLFVHECVHHHRNWIPQSLVAHHDGHHKYATRNFGVSTSFWDTFFGTEYPDH